MLSDIKAGNFLEDLDLQVEELKLYENVELQILPPWNAPFEA